MSHREFQPGDVTWSGTCHRCGRAVAAHIMSMFNRQLICLVCANEERKHPQYREAQEADVEACRRGETNFPGIGLPEDLM